MGELRTAVRHADAPRRGVGSGWGGQLRAQVAYANRDLWRNPVMAFITFVFPLVVLAMLGMAAADETDPLTGAPAIQSHAPVAAMFAGIMAALGAVGTGGPSGPRWRAA